jgi:hypothetical protein
MISGPSRIVTALVAGALTGASALAQGYVPPAPYAGARLTIPFHASSAEEMTSLKFGAGFRQADIRVQPGFAAREHFIFDGRFTTTGAASVNLNGIPLQDWESRLSADGDDGKGGSTGVIIGVVLGVVVVGGLASAAAQKDAATDVANAIGCAIGTLVGNPTCPRG